MGNDKLARAWERQGKQSESMKPVLLLVCLLCLSAASAALADDPLKWVQLPPLPDALGFGGPVVGTSENVLIVAGGANFPSGPPWPHGDSPAGNKVWHDRIFALEPHARHWTEAGKLPQPLAYAAAVSTSEGIYVLGGETSFHDRGNRPSADAWLLKWDARLRQVVVIQDALPALPRPSQYHQAAVIDDVIYVTASSARSLQSQQLDVKSFWSLDLKASPAKRRWNELNPWPGGAREKMSLAVQRAGAGQGEAMPLCLYLFSGENWFKDSNGKLDGARYEVFTDAYRYCPESDAWTRIADLPAVPAPLATAADSAPAKRERFDASAMPRPAVAATAIAAGTAHVLLFSGASDRFFHLPLQQRPPFPRDVLAYHTSSDAWTVAGEMPLGVVTTSAVRWNDRVVIPSGEIRPGVRTNHVQSLSPIPFESGLAP